MMKPLAGIRVLAIEQFGAGPMAQCTWPSLGPKSSKLKIARPVVTPLDNQVGDLGRDDSAYFQAFNLAKKASR